MRAQPKVLARLFRDPYVYGLSPSTERVAEALEGIVSSGGEAESVLATYHRTKVRGAESARSEWLRVPHECACVRAAACVCAHLLTLAHTHAHAASTLSRALAQALPGARPDARTFAAVATALRGAGFDGLVDGLREEFEANGVGVAE